MTAHWAAQAARYQAQTARDAHFTDLFTKAIEQLGATRDETASAGIVETKPNLEVRLGAIYSLERIAQDSERDHWPIIEVLCAYIRNRENCRTPKIPPGNLKPGSPRFRKWSASIEAPRMDIQAALNVIARRPFERLRHEVELGVNLDLSGANLQRAILGTYFLGADFGHSNLGGTISVKSSFEEAHFDAANLDNATFMGCNLSGAVFSDAHLIGTVFLGGSLSYAVFSRAIVNATSFELADMTGAWLFETDLSRAEYLTSEQLDKALGDVTTKIPKGLKRPSQWPDCELSHDDRVTWKENELR